MLISAMKNSSTIGGIFHVEKTPYLDHIQLHKLLINSNIYFRNSYPEALYFRVFLIFGGVDI